MAYTPVILATGGYDHKIRFWEATTGACTKTLSFGESQLNCLSISPDKSLLAAGGNSQLRLFDIKGSSSDGKPLISYEGHSGNVTAVGFQRDLKWLYTGSEDGTVRVWDPRSGTSSTRTYECGSSVNTVALNPNQAELITGDQNGNVKIWDLSADRCREEYVPAQDVPVRSISISFDASLVAVGSHKGKVFMYQTTSEKVCLHPCSHEGVREGESILTTHPLHTHTHTPPNLAKQQKLEIVGDFQAHTDYLLKCVISPDINVVATTSADKTIKLWSTSGKLETTLAQHQRWVWDAVFSADSLYLVSASSDYSARLWDLRTGEVIRLYSAGNNLAVTCVALNDSES